MVGVALPLRCVRPRRNPECSQAPSRSAARAAATGGSPFEGSGGESAGGTPGAEGAPADAGAAGSVARSVPR